MIVSMINALDARLSQLSILEKKQGILILMLHSLFKDDEEKYSGVIDPASGVTINEFEIIVKYYLDHEYTFIRLADLNKIDCSELSVCITFDDGYANNMLALPIINKYKIPITIFVTTKNVRDGTPFWWDVFFRKKKPISSEIKRLKTSQIAERFIMQGEDKPVGDIDRPLSLNELREMSSHELVDIGNHTHDHAILTNYSITEMREEISKSQELLKRWTGTSPAVIAYPIGNCSQEVVDIAAQNQFKFGVVASYIGDVCSHCDRLALSRVGISGIKNLTNQLSVASSVFSLKRTLSRIVALMRTK